METNRRRQEREGIEKTYETTRLAEYARLNDAQLQRAALAIPADPLRVVESSRSLDTNLKSTGGHVHWEEPAQGDGFRLLRELARFLGMFVGWLQTAKAVAA